MLLIRRFLTFHVCPKINKPHSVGKRHYTKALHRMRAQPCRDAKDDDFISPIIEQPDKSREIFPQKRSAISIMHWASAIPTLRFQKLTFFEQVLGNSKAGVHLCRLTAFMLSKTVTDFQRPSIRFIILSVLLKITKSVK